MKLRNSRYTAIILCRLILPQINIFDSEENTNVTLEHKNCIKCLGLLIDENLSWKNHIYTLTTKISKTVGIIAKLRHFVPNRTVTTAERSFAVFIRPPCFRFPFVIITLQLSHLFDHRLFNTR